MIAAPAIRLALPNDARAIAELSRDCIEQGLGWSWTPPRVLRSIRDPATNVAVIRQGGLIGFGIMQYGDSTAHLVLLAVRPGSRGRGLGAALVAWLEKSARTAGIERVRVETRADNPRAIAFYAKHDYQQLAVSAGYYQGLVDAIRFEKRLWSPYAGASSAD